MPVKKSTKRLLQKEIKKLQGKVADQQKVVNRLQGKYDSSFALYNSANDKLILLQAELQDYKDDIK